MDPLESTFRAVTDTISQGRIGTPVAARIVVQAGKEAAAFEAATRQALAAAQQWLGSKARDLEFHGEVGKVVTQTTLARFPAGQSALVTVVGGQPAAAALGVAVFGTRGVISLDPACIGVSDAAATQTPAKRWPSPLAPARPQAPPYGVLLVTGGFSHQEDYARALAADRRCRLIGVTDEAGITQRRKQYNEQLAKELGIPVLPSLDEALRRSDVHIVSICAEPERRGPIAVRCAEAGKHVYLDKPLCVSLAEADQIVAAVEKARVVHQMFSLVHLPHIGRIRRIIESGAIGKLVGLHVDLTFAKGPAGTADLRAPRKESETVTQVELRDTKRELTNVGVYPTVLLHWLLGERVTHVAATTGNYFFHEHQHNGQEDFGQMLLTTESGLVASVSAGRTGWQSHPGRGLDCTYLIGTEGVAVVDAHRPRLNVFADEQPWAAPPRHPEDPMGFWRSTAGTRAKNAWIAPSDAPVHDAIYFLDCIERGQASDVPAQIAAAATEVLLAAYRSAATGKRVEVTR